MLPDIGFSTFYSLVNPYMFWPARGQHVPPAGIPAMPLTGITYKMCSNAQKYGCDAFQNDVHDGQKNRYHLTGTLAIEK